MLSPLFNDKKEIDYTPYSFINLKNREYYPAEIKLDSFVEENELFKTYNFSYSAEGRRITGVANIPKKEGKLPVALLFRGWVDKNNYYPGLGSQNTGKFLADNGFLTLAPDFLGYGGSDQESTDMLLSRFFRPIEVISLYKSLINLQQADTEKVVIWAHSNGGQIALSLLEITGENIPTALWAPVSAAFPDCVLYFSDDLSDKGETLKGIMAKFGSMYKVEEYSVANFFDKINAPIILHQGNKDEAVPIEWSNNLYSSLLKNQKKITYHTYPNENHNFNLGSAPLMRQRDLEFFEKWLTEEQVNR